MINKFGKSIGNQLLQSRKYLISPNVQPQNFHSFLDFIKSNNSQLEVNSDNYHDFYLLNHEYNNIISDILIKPKFNAIKEEEEIENNLQQLKAVFSSFLKKTEIINDCTQLHFKIEHDPFNRIIRKLTEE